jgi:uncharacterized SAM-binding protein YcdF (DUF218 family)
MTDRIDRLAQTVWNYHLLNHSLKKSDVILVLCSHDPRVAERGAELFLEGLAPVIVFSGGVGALTRGLYEKAEADHFADIAIRLGVPCEKILTENESTNTGQNIRFSRDLLTSKNINPESFILVQKPFMERRAYATFKKVWPGKDVRVTSPRIKFRDYPTKDFPRERIIEIMVGDLQRIKEYPAMGFQIYQEIPDKVWKSFEELVSLGFDGHLIR